MTDSDIPTNKLCDISLDGPSAFHSALAEDGLMEEHIARCHTQPTSASSSLVLSDEEIVRITPRTCTSRDLLRLKATIAAKDREIVKAERDYWELHAGLTADTAKKSEVIIALESKLREAEERNRAAERLCAIYFEIAEEVVGEDEVRKRRVAALQDMKER
jgi:hypothetical protein